VREVTVSVLAPSLRGYKSAWLRSDLVAGATVWAVLVPEALAYATIAGAPPVVGLYAAAPALVLYAMFGSSRHLVVGPMSATAALSAATIATVADPSGSNYVALTAALAVVTGVVALLAGLLRLGFLAGFISEPVLKGFIVGLALTIIMGQLPKLFGVEGASGNFFEKLWGLVTALGGTHWPTFFVGILSLLLRARAPAVLATGPRFPRRRRPRGPRRHGVLPRRQGCRGRGSDHARPAACGTPGRGRPGPVRQPRRTRRRGRARRVRRGSGAAKTYAARAGYDVDANK
jgi:MFS superfamily sulfate permease-like transporter